jgi:hypothetical protein
MKRFGHGLLWGLGGYLLFAVVGYFLIGTLSSNVHDRSVEAAMTGVFVLGPLGAVLAFILGYVRGGRAAQPEAKDPS